MAQREPDGVLRFRLGCATANGDTSPSARSTARARHDAAGELKGRRFPRAGQRSGWVGDGLEAKQAQAIAGAGRYERHGPSGEDALRPAVGEADFHWRRPVVLAGEFIGMGRQLFQAADLARTHAPPMMQKCLAEHADADDGRAGPEISFVLWRRGHLLKGKRRDFSRGAGLTPPSETRRAPGKPASARR